MGFALRPGLSFCLIGGDAVFLDLSRDRYFGLTIEMGRCFVRLVNGDAPEAGDDRLIARLVGDAILMPAGGDEAPAPCPRPAIATSVLDEVGHLPWSPGSSLRALAGLALARMALRLGSLARMLDALAARKAAVDDQRPPTAADLTRVAAAFDASALAVSPLDACLPRSIAMARWLLGLGQPATLVVGVKLRPFQAHCWVQCGDRLVSDRIDSVRNFTPILVV